MKQTFSLFLLFWFLAIGAQAQTADDITGVWWNDVKTSKIKVEKRDGKYIGTLVQQGVYVWKASAVFKDGTIWSNENVGTSDPLPQTVYGTVTVIK